MTPSSKTPPIAMMAYRILPWVFLLWALYEVRLIASAATGKDSFFEIWLVWMSQAKTTRLTAFLFGLAGVAYGLAQRSLRRASESRLNAEIAGLKQRLAERDTP